MTVLITQENTTLVDDGIGVNFATEASQLGLPVGEFPYGLKTTLGNCQPFVFKSREDGFVLYHQKLGCCELAVFND